MIDAELVLALLINRGQAHHALFRAADELLAMHPLTWWERPCLRLLRWWAGRRLAVVLELVPTERRNEVLGMVAEGVGVE
jgi:hypothetical protein